MFPKRRAVAIHYGVPRKCVDQEWQKDLLRFLPKGKEILSVNKYIVPKKNVKSANFCRFLHSFCSEYERITPKLDKDETPTNKPDIATYGLHPEPIGRRLRDAE